MQLKVKHIVLFWLGFAFFMTGVMYVVHPISQKPFDVVEEFFWELSFALVWIPATPLVLRIARTYPVSRENILTRGLTIFTLGFALATGLCLSHGFLVFLFHRGAQELTANLLLFSLYYNIDKMIVIYCALVIMQHAIDNYSSLQEKNLRTAHLEAELSQAQMRALKMQLHPHFLFNTLNAIVTLIHSNPDAAEQMIVRLSDFLRLTLEHADRQAVTMKEEIQFVRAYLEIEKIRFQDRLKIDITVSPSANDAVVPNLLLQPIIENAIKHGISNSSEGGIVSVSVHVEDDKVHITVVNDAGSDQRFDKFPSYGIGLTNTKARLHSMYGGSATLHLQPLAPHGVEARIVLPFRTVHLN